jgi:hypothetical protein
MTKGSAQGEGGEEEEEEEKGRSRSLELGVYTIEELYSSTRNSESVSK